MPEPLHLYPSGLARDAALAALPPTAWTDTHRTFSEFAAQLDRALPLTTPTTIIDDVARFFVLSRAAQSKREELQRITSSETALKSAGALLASWKSAHLTPTDLRETATQAEKKPKTARCAPLLNELALLYELYEQRLSPSPLAPRPSPLILMDRESWERSLLARVTASPKLPSRVLAPNTPIELHGFHRLIAFQQDILESLTRAGHSVSPSPLLPFSPSPLLSLSSSPPLFFSSSAVTQRFEAPSLYAEVYEIGRRVRGWIEHDGIKPAEIAVTFRDLGAYSQALHDVFQRLGIPIFERRGEPARFQPLVRAALSAVDACLAGLHRAPLFRFLNSGPVDLAALAGIPNKTLDAETLHALALDAGIEHLFEADDNSANATFPQLWSARLQRYVARAGFGGDRRKKIEFHARALNAIVARMEALRGERSAKAHACNFRAFFEQCGLTSAAHARKHVNASSSLAPRTSSLAPIFKECESLRALETALQLVEDCPGAASEVLTLADFAALLNLALDNQSVRSGENERGGVRVLNFYDLRGLSFARVALGGLSENNCPARPAPDPLFGAGQERLVRDLLERGARDEGRGARELLPRLPEEHAAEERAIFDCARNSARELLVVSRPLRDGASALLGPSEYWSEFAGSCTLTAAISPAPPLQDCLIREEAELRAAWILSGANTPLPDAEKTREREWAVHAFQNSPRLQEAARHAAVERARQRFFVSQALLSAEAPEPANVRAATQPTRFDGAFGTGDHAGNIVSRLALEGTNDPLLSPGNIEQLAECPFRFFTGVLCKLSEHDEPGEEISPLDRGSLWHNILSRFIRERLDKKPSGQLTDPLDPSERSAAWTRLRELAEEELATVSERRFVGHTGFWRVQRKRLFILLEAWLDIEIQQPREGFHPAFVELDFSPKGEGRELRVPLNGANSLLIRGRMDRLDLRTEIKDGKPLVTALRILDYKLSQSDYKDKIATGALASLVSAQLPIYFSAAIENLIELERAGILALDLPRIWSESRAGYYVLRDTPKSRRESRMPLLEVKDWPLDNDLEAFLNLNAPEDSGGFFSELREKFAATLRGRFDVHPLACAGTHCPARRACRFQAIPSSAAELFQEG